MFAGMPSTLPPLARPAPSEGPVPAAPPASRPITRRLRLLAAARDALALLPAIAVALAIAVAWLLARTAWGRDDVRDVDSAVALATLAAVPPAWLARIAFGLVTAQATPGQRACRLRVEVTRARRRLALGLRLALHPFGAAGWAWVAAVLALAGAFAIALAVAAIALALALGAVASLAMILADPDTRALHDRVAGTRLVRA